MSWNIVCQPVSAEASPVGEYGVKLLLPPLLPPPVRKLMAKPYCKECTVACIPSVDTICRGCALSCNQQTSFLLPSPLPCLETTSSFDNRSFPFDTWVEAK